MIDLTDNGVCESANKRGYDLRGSEGVRQRRVSKNDAILPLAISTSVLLVFGAVIMATVWLFDCCNTAKGIAFRSANFGPGMNQPTSLWHISHVYFQNRRSPA